MWEFIPKPVIALIFLYEIKDMHKEVIKLTEGVQDDNTELLNSENPFFIPQKISNACGTIALLHAICNTAATVGGARPGSFLEKLLLTGAAPKFSLEASVARADYVNQSQELETIHLKYAVQGNQGNMHTEAKCHYVTYVLGP